MLLTGFYEFFIHVIFQIKDLYIIFFKLKLFSINRYCQSMLLFLILIFVL